MLSRPFVMAVLVVVILLAGCLTTQPTAPAASASSLGPTDAAHVSPSDAPSTGAAWAACVGDGFSIEFPAGWYVHPPDEAMRVARCTLFAARPFEGQLEDDGGWTGAQIVVRLATGCQGSFEVVLAQEELEIEGYPAWARHLAVGEGPDRGRPSAYAYAVNLAPGRPCEQGRWLVARTEVSAPGDHAENSLVLDEMMQTIRFTGAE